MKEVQFDNDIDYDRKKRKTEKRVFVSKWECFASWIITRSHRLLSSQTVDLLLQSADCDEFRIRISFMHFCEESVSALVTLDFHFVFDQCDDCDRKTHPGDILKSERIRRRNGVGEGDGRIGNAKNVTDLASIHSGTKTPN
jgi:hypothetical protein